MMKWISVKDRLPEDTSTVIISCVDGIKEAEFWASNVRGHRGKWFFEPPYYGQSIAGRFKRTTHWMPMPEPPK